MKKPKIYYIDLSLYDFGNINDLLLYVGSLNLDVNCPITLRDIENREETGQKYMLFIENENMFNMYSAEDKADIERIDTYEFIQCKHRVNFFQAIIKHCLPL